MAQAAPRGSTVWTRDWAFTFRVVADEMSKTFFRDRDRDRDNDNKELWKVQWA
jgi:hypothetical protein